MKSSHAAMIAELFGFQLHRTARLVRLSLVGQKAYFVSWLYPIIEVFNVTH